MNATTDTKTFFNLAALGPVLLGAKKTPIRLIGALIIGYNAYLAYQSYLQNQQQQQTG